MFLLIQLTGTQKRIQKINFKFHYVSINSKLKSILTGEQAALNSIMFLLILQEHPASKFLYLPLNSIMFLLIHVLVTVEISCVFALNSIMFLLIHISLCQCQYFLITLNSIMFLLIPVPKPTAYLLHETPLFCRPLQNISFLSHSSSYVLVTPPILAIFYFCRFPAFFTLSQVDRNHYIFIISSFLLA